MLVVGLAVVVVAGAVVDVVVCFFWVVDVVVVAGLAVVVVDPPGDDDVVVDPPAPPPNPVTVLDVVELDDVVESRGVVDGGGSVGGASLRTCRLNDSGVAVSICLTGKDSTARTMYAAHMRAGKVPPATLTPCTDVMGTILSGYPTHTAVANWGTKPTNQASP